LPFEKQAPQHADDFTFRCQPATTRFSWLGGTKTAPGQAEPELLFPVSLSHNERLICRFPPPAQSRGVHDGSGTI